MKRLIHVTTCIAAAVTLVTATIWVLFQQSNPERPLMEIGKEAPNITLTTLEGSTVRLSEYRGKPVLLQFWGSWCTSCVNEMPVIDQYYKQGKVNVLGINVGQSRGTVASFIQSLGVSYPQFLDPSGTAAEAYRVKELPVTFLIDSNQKLTRIITGELTNVSQLESRSR
ncbi:redoxin domain-containing protein [Paenibacillus xylaniclasticus]|uniref:redoxin domain-containing protein n=1 Tax=Paenibacillus xylaniclasticus TaxID=588083 RepID=UPI0013E07AE5|nr:MULTISPECIES: redoxin domain-containing protein [Paenibacillus]